MASQYAIESVFRLVDQVSNPLGKIGYTGKKVSDALKTSFFNAEKSLDSMANTAKKALGVFMKYANIAVVGTFAVKGIKDATQFQTVISKIGTVSEEVRARLPQLQKEFFQVANAAGFAVDEISKIALTAIPSGIAADAAAEFAGVVAKTNKITNVSADAIVDALTSVMNTYELAGGEASRVAGLFVQANNMGKTSIEEMNKSFRQILPDAHQYGVSIEDVFAGFTALTAKGEKTKDATKLLGDAFSKIANPSKKAAALAKNIGLDFSEAALRSKGFAGVMRDIAKATGGNRQALEVLFENKDIARIMGTLATNGREAFEDALKQMTSGASGVIDKAFEQIANTPEEKFKATMNRIRNLGIQLGNMLLPLVGKVLDIANNIINSIHIEKIGGQIQFVGGIIISVLPWLLRLAAVALAIAGAFKAWRLFQILWLGTQAASNLITSIATGFQIAYASAVKGSVAATSALGFANGTTVKSCAFFSGILAKLTGATVVQTGATVGATGAQAALNAVMTANPVGVIIMAIAALVGLLVLLVKNIDYVKAALITLGDLIKTVLLLPLQGLLELIDLIPGVDLEATKVLRKENGGFFSRTKDRFTTVHENRVAKKQAKEKAQMDEWTKQYGIETPNLETPDLGGIGNFDFDLPGFGGSAGSATGGASGKNPLHGVYDVSGAAPAMGGGSSGGGKQGIAQAAQSAVDSAVQLILNAVRSIDANITRIAAWSLAPEGSLVPAPVTAGERTAYSLQESRNISIIELRAAAGTDAEIKQASPETNIRLIRSGGNSYA